MTFNRCLSVHLVNTHARPIVEYAKYFLYFYFVIYFWSILKYIFDNGMNVKMEQNVIK